MVELSISIQNLPPEFSSVNPTSLFSEGFESPGHSVDLAKVLIVDREPRYFEQGIKEVIPYTSRRTNLHKTETVALQTCYQLHILKC